MEAVTVSLEQVKKGLSPHVLEQAFGPDSLGIIVIKDLSEQFVLLRRRVLKSASILANLSPEQLEKLESKELFWLTGWSCGKEILASSGKPDYNKGSYYINCAFHKDEKLEGPTRNLTEKFQDFRAYTEPNIWPDQNIDGLEQFEQNCKLLCNLIIDVAEHVATNCDDYIKKVYPEYERGFLNRIVKNSTCTKARLLHYYPSQDASDDWCGEHLDHSCLTGLTSALFLDETQGLTHDVPSPDPNSGLYIKSRNNDVVKVNIPADCLAFQTGSALQEVSRGKFKAVPHHVKGTSMHGIARNTLAVFCQPDLDEMVNDTENFAMFADRIVRGNH